MSNRFTRRTFLKGVGAFAGATALSGPFVSFAQDGLAVGAVVPLTGQLQSFGPRFQVAAELAVDEVNNAGGIPGIGNLVLQTRDSGTNPDQAVQAATELINVNDVPALFGAASSSSTISVTSVTIPNEVLQISPSATSPTLTGLDDNDFVFRTAPPDSFQGAVLADLAFNVKEYRTIAIIARNDAYGAGLADITRQNFEAIGGTVSNVSLYDPNIQDFSAEIEAAAEGDPDAISLITFDEGEQLMVQMVSAGVPQFDLLVDGNQNQDLLDRVAESIGPDLLAGKVGTAPDFTKSGPGGDPFAQRYQAAQGEEPFVFTPHSFDALAVMALAAARAGEASGPALRDALRSVSNAGGTEFTVGQLGEAMEAAAAGEEINYQGASGAVEFNQNGDPFGPIAVWTIDDGAQIQNVASVNCNFDDEGNPSCESVPEDAL